MNKGSGSERQKIKETVGKPKLSKSPGHHCVIRKLGLSSETKKIEL